MSIYCATLITLAKCSTTISKKNWQIGTQNKLGGENFGTLNIYTERNQGKTEKLADKTRQIIQKSPKVFYRQSQSILLNRYLYIMECPT